MAKLDTPVTIEFKAFGQTITWPSTPKISQSIEVNYSTWELQHTNYQPSAFGNRSTPTVSISGQWFSRTTEEATTTLQAIHLMRAATSMYYGRQDKNKGTPPPIGRFNAHGLYNNTPVVVKSFQYDYPNDVDYITADLFGGTQAVPVLFEMSVSLIIQINMIDTVKDYTLEKFLNGDLLGDGYI